MKKLDLLDVPEEARELIRDCELQGTKTLFTRGDREVAVLVSWDEYLALRETLAITNDPLFFAKLETAEEEVRKGKMLLVEDLG